ncbi:hypothetical protein [Gordonia terrae]|uniref:Uncharacterized protein n=2 Tax=Gordonia terrae TaxID=2055 RepID=A0AAD0NV01_9ACTN|nr:hypothetical protein [Gordonia terrae]VTR06942.1 Uncharacterised protein [Clostridioides difficile]ANY22623.1 hypothetical protein BCM27_07235 [Gordonia terrae]AWO83361.1 hypothetical protein DLJ61_07305 [Gordonia terrae]VTS38575.1 Uncharacterised protein [Gordonia terrae]GAB43277.1 hypothetical protein GOTRE_039_01170 [Gordonia terrae NBRC 100016]
MPNARMVSLVALSLIVGQLIIRGWLVATGNFYWDDLVLVARASSNPILSWEYLGHSHDGHFMPAAFLLAGVATWLAPLNWVLPALMLVAMQAIASVAVWRMVRTIAPRARIGALVALAFYLFSPMTVPAFAWWAAGLNTLPLQAAMAWIVADAVRLARGDVDDARRRLVWVRSTIVFLIALAFFEKSLFILPVALVAAVLANGGPRATTATLRAARELWLALTVVAASWVAVYFITTDPTSGEHSVAQTARLVWRSVTDAIVPSLVGGPWEWERWTPSPPTGFPQMWMIVGGWLVLAVVTWWAVARRRGGAVIVACAALYAVAAQIPVMWNRSSPQTAIELAQHMRYLPDTALVFSIALAVLCAAPARNAEVGGRHARTSDAESGLDEERSALPAFASVVGALVAVSALVSLVSFSSSWRDNPTGDYLETATASLHDAAAQGPDGLTMLDQSVPLEILQPFVYPDNQISRIFGRVDPRPDFGAATDRLFVLDTAGNLVPGGVTQRRIIYAGSGTCRTPEVDGPSRLRLDGPLFSWPWTIALSYCATRDGEIEIALEDGEAVRAPVRAGLGSVYVRIDGGGDRVDIRPLTPGLRLHTGAGRVGEAAEARFAGG